MPLIALLLAIASAFAQDPGEVRIVVRKSAFVLNVVQGDSTIRTYRIAVGKNPGNKQRRGIGAHLRGNSQSRRFSGRATGFTTSATEKARSPARTDRGSSA